MSPRTRRAYLGALGTSIAAVAGCSSTGPTETSPTGETPVPDTGASPGSTDTTTQTPARLALERIDDPAASDREFVVVPPKLREWVRRASDGETVRGHADVGFYTPEPVLPAFDALRVLGPDGDRQGDFTVDAEGGTRYELLAGAEADDPPADSEVTPVADLSEPRRELATAAIAGSNDARVYPETELGSWVRHEFFGGYYRHDGTVYRGKEREQTDAGFSSRALWLVLRLSPVADGGDDVPFLRLDEVDETVREWLDRLLAGESSSKTPPSSATSTPTDLPESVATFGRETDAILTFTGAYDVSLR